MERMEAVSSSAYTSDESAVEPSIAPTTPEGSPFFCASRTYQGVEKRLPSLSDFDPSHDLSRSDAGRGHLPGILDPATAASRVVRNICFIGAGYVGESSSIAAVSRLPITRYYKTA
jgi:hypothetical protein